MTEAAADKNQVVFLCFKCSFALEWVAWTGLVVGKQKKKIEVPAWFSLAIFNACSSCKLGSVRDLDASVLCPVLWTNSSWILCLCVGSPSFASPFYYSFPRRWNGWSTSVTVASLHLSSDSHQRASEVDRVRKLLNVSLLSGSVLSPFRSSDLKITVSASSQMNQSFKTNCCQQV